MGTLLVFIGLVNDGRVRLGDLHALSFSLAICRFLGILGMLLNINLFRAEKSNTSLVSGMGAASLSIYAH